MDTSYKALQTSAPIQMGGMSISEEQWNSFNRLLFVLDKLDITNFRDARVFVRSVLDANPEHREALIRASRSELLKKNEG